MKKLLFLILLPLLSFSSVFAKGYINISPAQPTQTDNKIEVLEIFWYGCPHCYKFEPYIKQWLATKADDVEFKRMPGILNKSWLSHGRAYFTAQKLGVLDTIHSALFDAIHREKKSIYDEDALKHFFIENGVNRKKFSQVYHSDEIHTKIKQAIVMGQRYKLTGVPAIIVNGKYMVNTSSAGSISNVFKTINQLIEKERALTKEK